MHVRRFSTHVEVLAPAKVNLFLEILGKRADGFHEIDTVMAGVSIYDSLRFQATGDRMISLNCRWGLGLPSGPIYEPIPSGSENLVWRAIQLVKEANAEL